MHCLDQNREGRRELRNQLDSDVNEEIINRATVADPWTAHQRQQLLSQGTTTMQMPSLILQPCLSSIGVIHAVHAGHVARRLCTRGKCPVLQCCYLFEWATNDVLRVPFQDPAPSASKTRVLIRFAALAAPTSGDTSEDVSSQSVMEYTRQVLITRQATFECPQHHPSRSRKVPVQCKRFRRPSGVPLRKVLARGSRISCSKPTRRGRPNARAFFR